MGVIATARYLSSVMGMGVTRLKDSLPPGERRTRFLWRDRVGTTIDSDSVGRPESGRDFSYRDESDPPPGAFAPPGDLPLEINEGPAVHALLRNDPMAALVVHEHVGGEPPWKRVRVRLPAILADQVDGLKPGHGLPNPSTRLRRRSFLSGIPDARGLVLRDHPETGIEGVDRNI